MVLGLLLSQRQEWKTKSSFFSLVKMSFYFPRTFTHSFLSLIFFTIFLAFAFRLFLLLVFRVNDRENWLIFSTLPSGHNNIHPGSHTSQCGNLNHRDALHTENLSFSRTRTVPFPKRKSTNMFDGLEKRLISFPGKLGLFFSFYSFLLLTYFLDIYILSCSLHIPILVGLNIMICVEQFWNNGPGENARCVVVDWILFCALSCFSFLKTTKFVQKWLSWSNFIFSLEKWRGWIFHIF